LQPPKYPQLMLLTVGVLRPRLNQNIRLRPKKYLGKLLWLRAHPLEYLGRARKYLAEPSLFEHDQQLLFPTF